MCVGGHHMDNHASVHRHCISNYRNPHHSKTRYSRRAGQGPSLCKSAGALNNLRVLFKKMFKQSKFDFNFIAVINIQMSHD